MDPDARFAGHRINDGNNLTSQDTAVSPKNHSQVSALDPQRRVWLVDALRGAALFGVLLVNMLWFAGYGNSVTEEQFARLPTAVLDRIVDEAIDQLVFAKSIGIFAFLFGVGFAMQMDRLQASGRMATQIYLRRLSGLLLLGLIHWFAIWSGEILHVYALAGMALLLVYRWPSRVLIGVGLPLAVLARPLLVRAHLLFGEPGTESGINAANEVAHRLSTFLHGSLVDIAAMQIREDCLPEFASGALIAAIVHALGRFMIGVVCARGRYLEQADRFHRQVLWIAVSALPLGLLAQRDWLFVGWLQASRWISTDQQAGLAGHICNSLGVVLMTAGYVAAFCYFWHRPNWQRILATLVPVGQMALTNYLLQTLINGVLFYGFGLGLMGRVGASICLVLAIAIFLVQVVGSSWWMARFRFGPVEWAWRWWTYGQRPAFLRA